MFLERIDVFSPKIASIGYNDDKQLLQIEFHNMCIFNYIDVLRRLYEKCIYADSVEQYFQTNIENYYESDRVL